MPSWAALVDALQANEQLTARCAAFLTEAQAIADRPIVQRVYRLADVGVVGRTGLDGRAATTPEAVRELFALSMSDCNASDVVYQELPSLSAAYRMSGDRRFLNRVLAQLAEMTTWSPLQRPGWTLFGPKARSFIDPKGDGNWLATGRCILAILETLELLPTEDVSPSLRAQLDALLAHEIEICLDDWTTKRPWFYQWENPFTNQWVVPTAGYLLAALHLGREQHAEAYELGVRNLLQSLDAYGEEGAFVEGLTYSGLTAGVLLRTARMLALAGDRRLIVHPFLQHFPEWVVQHYQPAGHFINTFDAVTTTAVPLHHGKCHSPFRALLAAFAHGTGNAAARWALQHLEDGEQLGFDELLATALPPLVDDTPPPCWAAYQRAARVNWRSSWDTDATGVWVRGGHADDQHDHADRGHVNFIYQGRSILIEAGTPVYHHPLFRSHYSGSAGHNVLQIGELTPDEIVDISQKQLPYGFQKKRGVAPITVHRLDADGGEVTVDATACYLEGSLTSWHRRVCWDAETVETRDEVALAAPDVIGFRWHLGTGKTPEITQQGTQYTLTWADAVMTVTADVDIMVRVVPMPDNTLVGRTADVTSLHSCVVIRTSHHDTHAGITTRVSGRRDCPGK